MRVKAFSIFDTIAGAYNQPFFTHNRGTAIRSIQGELKKEGSPLAANPDQFGLFEIGEYDDEKGLMIPREVPDSLGLVQEFIPRS